MGERPLDLPAAIMPPVYNAVLFDLDDTLIDRRAAFLRWARAFYAAQPAVRAAAAWDEAAAALVELDARGATDRPEFFSRVRQRWPGVIGSAQELESRYWPVFATSVRPDPRSLALVRGLRDAGIPWGIVTNGGPYQRDKLRSAHMDGLATAVVISGVVGISKPDPAIFRHALRLVRGEPRSTLFVGDNPVADIAGATAAGISTAWVRNDRLGYPEHCPKPDMIVDHVADLTGVLLGGRGRAVGKP